MASEAGQAVSALRQRIERINADRKNHGFGFLAVRGLIKAKAHALWHAIANNLMAARRSRANAWRPLPSGQSAPEERLTRTGFIHDPDHSSTTGLARVDSRGSSPAMTARKFVAQVSCA